MSIKIKITSMVLLGLLILALSLGAISYNKSKKDLLKINYDSLTTSRDIKIEQISNFFKERVTDIEVLSRGKDVKELLYDMHKLNRLVEFDPDSAIPITNALVKSITNPHEIFFQKYIKAYNYYDIFIIDPTTGHVVYTALKESDYGTNLRTGPLKKSALAEVYAKVKKEKKTVLVDMKPYPPSNNIHAMFMATPIFIDNAISGILVLQISDKAIQNIMNFRSGYGKSQETYLVGKDFLMRSDSYLDPVNHSLVASFSNPLKGRCDTEAIREALSGNSATKIVIDYNGNRVLSSYAPLKIYDDLTWAIASEIDEIEVLIDTNILRNEIIQISFILFTIVSIVLLVLLQITLIYPLRELEDAMLAFFKKLNREENSIQKEKSYNNNELQRMTISVNKNIATAQKIFDELEYEAKYDSLTNIANRLLFVDRLEQALKQARRSKMNIAVFFIDLDNFKIINDTLGHHYGDLVLQHVAKSLSNSIRESDTVARLGGDEFAILVQDVKDKESLTTLAKKLIKLIDKPMLLQGENMHVTLSIGIALSLDNTLTIDELLEKADDAMYEAKRNGRNCFVFK